MSGSHLGKAKSRHQIASLIPGRHEWEPSQKWRTQYIADQRSGPHINICDPFVEREKMGAAARLLRAPLSDLRPFSCRLLASNMARAVYPSSATLYVSLLFEPPDAFRSLSCLFASLFPQCNDLAVNSPSGRSSSLFLASPSCLFSSLSLCFCSFLLLLMLLVFS